MIPADVAAFGSDVAAVLATNLGDELVGAYFIGSLALDGFVENESDIDIVAVCRERLTQERRGVLATQLAATTARCPARGLELTLYRLEVAADPADTDFEVNVNGGPRMDASVRLSRGDHPSFWWVLDRAIAHRFAVPIAGPRGGEVFADVPRHALLDAMTESMRWHRQHERATLYSVLNASRAWHFAVEGRLVSKLDGAAWAKRRWRKPSVIDAAVALRRGQSASLDGADVEALLAHVEGALESARMRYSAP